MCRLLNTSSPYGCTHGVHCLLPSSSAKISFSNTLLISETTFSSTAKNLHCIMLANIPKTLKVFSLGFCRWRQTLQVIRNKFRGRISPQPQECGARLITVMNEPVPRPSTTSFAFSQAKHFRKDMLLNIGIEKAWTWYATHSMHQRNGDEPSARNINLFHKKNATVLILARFQNSN